jgi:hypothetical protein
MGDLYVTLPRLVGIDLLGPIGDRQDNAHRRIGSTRSGLSAAAMDAVIAVFDAKYKYEFWRPITAIRNGDIDGILAWSFYPLARARSSACRRIRHAPHWRDRSAPPIL